ncbi:MAG TPA: hypothetical protein PKK78_16515 [Kouleothrix sp.]|nr:hypothetical protein [Kouleothrix sp.]
MPNILFAPFIADKPGILREFALFIAWPSFRKHLRLWRLGFPQVARSAFGKAVCSAEE